MAYALHIQQQEKAHLTIGLDSVLPADMRELLMQVVRRQRAGQAFGMAFTRGTGVTVLMVQRTERRDEAKAHKQYSSQHAFPTWMPAWPMWMEITSRMVAQV
jgi:hypothetical protein